MNEQRKASFFTRILLPTDFSPGAEQALEHALALAGRHGASLVLLHVVEIPGVSIPYLREDYYVEEKQRALGQMSLQLAKHDTRGLTIETVVLPGPVATPAAPAILEYAREHGIDFIVMGTHGRRGLRRRVMGSVAEEVVREATCPVLTVRRAEGQPAAEAPHRILVPVDFSKRSEEALDRAVQLAREGGAELVLLHVVEIPYLPGIYGMVAEEDYADASTIEERAEARLRTFASRAERLGIQTTVLAGSGRPAEYIVDFARESMADLIVMGSHGLTGLDRFLMGSVTERVLRTAHCPVLVVKGRRRRSGASGDAARERPATSEMQTG